MNKLFQILFRRWLPFFLLGMFTLFPPVTASLKAEPILTILRGEEADGTGQFLRDLQQLWKNSNQPTNHRLDIRTEKSLESRLRSLERGRAHFAIVDTASAIRLLGDNKKLVAIGLLWPNFLHALSGKPGLVELKFPIKENLFISKNSAYVFQALKEWNNGKKRYPASPRMIPQGTDPWDVALEGEGIVLFSSPAPLFQVSKALQENQKLRMVRISNKIIEELGLIYPWLHSETMPKSTYPGLTRNWELPAWRPLMVGRKGLEDEIVKKMLKMLYSRNKSLKAGNPLFRLMNGKANQVFAKLLPFHPVTARRYRFSDQKP